MGRRQCLGSLRRASGPFQTGIMLSQILKVAIDYSESMFHDGREYGENVRCTMQVHLRPKSLLFGPIHKDYMLALTLIWLTKKVLSNLPC
jgi:hypothetical protein